MIQWFEGSYATQERRAVDLFSAGYGGIWVPPASRGQSGGASVGYDVFNRFDLGGPDNPTRYGTETGLKTAVSEIQKTGAKFYLDLVWNHDGTNDSSTPGFVASGGYPGMVLTYPGTSDGDFHSAFASGDQNERLAGLVDIDQSSNIQLIRNPVTGGDPRNIPAGTVNNVPTSANLRFYQDRSGPPSRYVFDPTTGEQNIPIWDFTSASATSGTPVAENALGYLMRNAQWLVQTVGVDGFRLDATKNYPSWVLNYYDRAVYRTSTHTLLDGSQEQVFAFGEYYDGSSSAIQQTIRKDVNPADPGRIGGNRDALDFPLYFAMQSNLSNNGLANDWRNVIHSSLDGNDDGKFNNGSQGVSFVQSADSPAPYLNNVAYAFTLVRPGNAIVYYNAHEDPGSAFPQDGRGDALGGRYGTLITTLNDIRLRYPQGDYVERDVEKETLVVERSDSLIAGYSNRLDGGYDTRTVQTNFSPGTPLVELTGNAANKTVDPTGVIPDVVYVNAGGQVTIAVPRNKNVNGVEHDKGYVIYGPQTPQGSLVLSGVAQTLSPDVATSANNGSARVSSVSVVKSDVFAVNLATNPVVLPDNSRDPNADGDNAVLKVDDGLDVNGNGSVDFTTPNSVVYGFENFLTYKSPRYGGGDGLYVQDVDATRLSEGMHYIEVRAFRHRSSGEPAVFSSWRIGVYVDRLPPNSVIQSFSAVTAGVNETRRAMVQNVDLTADNVHILYDLPPALTNAQILAMISSSTQATRDDRDLWHRDLSNVTSGNHVLTVVSYEPDGNYNVQRYPGFLTSTIYGAGLGDANFDGAYSPLDIDIFGHDLLSNGALFNPAADLNGDGVIGWDDFNLLLPRLLAVDASPQTLNEYFILRSGIVPEPPALAILAAPLAALARKRKRNTSPQGAP